LLEVRLRDQHDALGVLFVGFRAKLLASDIPQHMKQLGFVGWFAHDSANLYKIVVVAAVARVLDASLQELVDGRSFGHGAIPAAIAA